MVDEIDEFEDNNSEEDHQGEEESKGQDRYFRSTKTTKIRRQTKRSIEKHLSGKGEETLSRMTKIYTDVRPPTMGGAANIGGSKGRKG